MQEDHVKGHLNVIVHDEFLDDGIKVILLKRALAHTSPLFRQDIGFLLALLLQQGVVDTTQTKEVCERFSLTLASLLHLNKNLWDYDFVRTLHQQVANEHKGSSSFSLKIFRDSLKLQINTAITTIEKKNPEAVNQQKQAYLNDEKAYAWMKPILEKMDLNDLENNRVEKIEDICTY